MMQLTTKDNNSKVTVSQEVFDYKYNEGLVHQAVTTFMNNARTGNSAQKTRSEVRGGGKKPWNQKGTGRARAGTIRSPIWRSGGVTFASKKRDYSQKLNKKMYVRALRSILSELNRQGRLVLLNEFALESPKTKDFVKKMQELNLDNALIVMNELGENEYLASRNCYNFEVCDVTCVTPYHLLKYSNVVFTKDAIKTIEGQLQ